jgi:hypothetical protein
MISVQAPLPDDLLSSKPILSIEPVRPAPLLKELVRDPRDLAAADRRGRPLGD